MDLSRFLCLTALSGITLLTSPLHAQFVDMFNGTAAADATNYTYAVSFGSGGVTFAINGNTNPQFQPTTSTFGTTTQFYRNDSTLSDSVFGNTVSVEIDNIGDFSAAGLAFNTSTSGPNYLEFSINTGPFSSGVALSSLTNTTKTFDVDFNAGSILETVTRTGDTTLAYTFTGPGLTNGITPDGPITGTITDANFAGQNIVFGLDTYSGNSPGAQIEDNLAFALTVPEPSTWALMFGGVAMLACIIRLRAARFARD
jgi:hypothetical protein